MKKRTAVVVLAAVLLMVLTAGCGSEDGGDNLCGQAVAAAAEKMGEDTALDASAVYGEETYDDNFERLYNFSIDLAADGAIAYSSSGSAADEISLIKAADSGDVSKIKKYLEARLEQRLHDFQNYMPEEVSKIENGKVVVMKQYVFLIISDRPEEIETAIKEVLS